MNEEDIILKAQQGDQKSIDYIFEKYKPLVVSLSRKYFLIGGTIEDTIQEGYIGLFKALTTYKADKNASFLTFSRLCIERNLMTAINKANNIHNYILNNSESFDADNEEYYGHLIKDNTPSPEEHLISNEIIKELKINIDNKLSQLEKNVLNLFIVGKSYKVIAEKLNITTKCVDNTLERIRKKLSSFKNINHN